MFPFFYVGLAFAAGIWIGQGTGYRMGFARASLIALRAVNARAKEGHVTHEGLRIIEDDVLDSACAELDRDHPKPNKEH